MNYWMVRTFDHAAYYETRLILSAVCLALACYFAYYKRDRRYLIAFASGAILQALTEYLLQWNGLRGVDYTLWLFGRSLPFALRPIYQGLTEGGAVALFAFWFADLRAARAKANAWLPFAGLCLLVLALSLIVGMIDRRQPITSIRPMFETPLIFGVTGIIFASLFPAWRRGAFAALAGFYGGLVLFALLNYEPLQMLGARYLGVLAHGRVAQVAGMPQYGVMLLSHLFEAGGGKLHYFLIPFVLGLLPMTEPEDPLKRERYSTQHLQDLTQRGWRKRSKPFQP